MDWEFSSKLEESLCVILGTEEENRGIAQVGVVYPEFVLKCFD